MPLVRIALAKGRPAAYRRKLADAVQAALVDTFNVPATDRFQLITEYDAEDFIFDPEYLGIARSRDLVILQLTVSFGRTPAQKRALYRAITDRLALAVQQRPEDVLITLVETARENWCFGNGIAAYAPEEAVAA